MPSRLPTAIVAAALLTHCCAGGLLAAEGHDVPLREDLPLWGIVAFIGFLFAVKKLGWDALTSGMRDREASENRLIGEAETLRQQAAAQLTREKGNMEALDEHVREVLAEADRDAAHTRSDIRSVGEREAAVIQARAELEISRTRDQSLHDIFQKMADRVAAAVEQRIRTGLTPQHQQELVDAAVNEFATQGRV